MSSGVLVTNQYLLVDAKSQSQVTIVNSAIFQQIWNIAYPLISLDQSTFISDGLVL